MTNGWTTRHALSVAATLLWLAIPAGAQRPTPDERVAELRTRLSGELQRIASGFDGVLGAGVQDLTTGETIFIQADTLFPQASAIKIPVLLEVYRQAQAGTMKLDERVDIRKAQFAGGSGVLLRFSDGGSALSIRDLAVLMIVLSDNTATNILMDRAGMAAVNENLRRLGLTQTRVQRRMLDVEAQRADRENVSTPGEMVTLLERLYQGKALDAAHTAAALEILKYPKENSLRRGIPPGVEVADKPGSVPGVACNSAIVYVPGRPYVISVMTTYGRDAEAAGLAITQISRRVYEYFERLANSNASGARVR